MGRLRANGWLDHTVLLLPRRWENRNLPHRRTHLRSSPVTWSPNFVGGGRAHSSGTSVGTFFLFGRRCILALEQTSQSGFLGRCVIWCALDMASASVLGGLGPRTPTASSAVSSSCASSSNLPCGRGTSMAASSERNPPCGGITSTGAGKATWEGRSVGHRKPRSTSCLRKVGVTRSHEECA